MNGRRICVQTPCLPPQIREGCGQGASQLPTPQLRNSQSTSNSQNGQLGCWWLGINWELRVCGIGNSYLLYNSTISCSCTGRLICSRVRSDAAGHRALVEREPLGNAAALHFLERVLDGRVLRAARLHADGVARLDRV